MRTLINPGFILSTLAATSSLVLGSTISYEQPENYGRFIYENSPNLIVSQIFSDNSWLDLELVDYEQRPNTYYQGIVNEDCFDKDLFFDVVLSDNYSEFHFYKCSYYQWQEDFVACERIMVGSDDNHWFHGEIYHGVEYTPSLIEFNDGKIHLLIDELFENAKYVMLNIKVSWLFHKEVTLGVPTSVEECATSFTTVFKI